jgi:crotonobetainyl-CoA:carnitine CoA-transferase CaiB-like acyl-CoA transferase
VIYEGLETADGPIVIAAGNDALFHKLCPVIGKPEWASDPRLATNRQRIERRDEIVAELQRIMLTKPRAYWLKAIGAAQIPCTAINSLTEMLAEPQTEAIGMLQEVPNLERGIRLIALPLQFDGKRPPIRNRAPRVGEHTNEVFGES